MQPTKLLFPATLCRAWECYIPLSRRDTGVLTCYLRQSAGDKQASDGECGGGCPSHQLLARRRVRAELVRNRRHTAAPGGGRTRGGAGTIRAHPRDFPILSQVEVHLGPLFLLSHCFFFARLSESPYKCALVGADVSSSSYALLGADASSSPYKDALLGADASSGW